MTAETWLERKKSVASVRLDLQHVHRSRDVQSYAHMSGCQKAAECQRARPGIVPSREGSFVRKVSRRLYEHHAMNRDDSLDEEVLHKHLLYLIRPSSLRAMSTALTRPYQ